MRSNHHRSRLEAERITHSLKTQNALLEKTIAGLNSQMKSLKDRLRESNRKNVAELESRMLKAEADLKITNAMHTQESRRFQFILRDLRDSLIQAQIERDYILRNFPQVRKILAAGIRKGGKLPPREGNKSISEVHRVRDEMTRKMDAMQESYHRQLTASRASHAKALAAIRVQATRTSDIIKNLGARAEAAESNFADALRTLAKAKQRRAPSPSAIEISELLQRNDLKLKRAKERFLAREQALVRAHAAEISDLRLKLNENMREEKEEESWNYEMIQEDSENVPDIEENPEKNIGQEQNLNKNSLREGVRLSIWSLQEVEWKTTRAIESAMERIESFQKSTRGHIQALLDRNKALQERQKILSDKGKSDILSVSAALKEEEEKNIKLEEVRQHLESKLRESLDACRRVREGYAQMVRNVGVLKQEKKGEVEKLRDRLEARIDCLSSENKRLKALRKNDKAASEAMIASCEDRVKELEEELEQAGENAGKEREVLVLEVERKVEAMEEKIRSRDRQLKSRSSQLRGLTESIAAWACKEKQRRARELEIRRDLNRALIEAGRLLSVERDNSNKINTERAKKSRKLEGRLRSEVENLERELARMKEKAHNLQTQKGRLRMQLQDKEKEYDDYCKLSEEERRKFLSQLKKGEIERLGLKNEIEQKEKELEKQKEEKGLTAHNLAETTKQLSALKEKNDLENQHASNHVNLLSSRIKSLTKDLASLKSICATKQANIDNLIAQTSSFSNQLEAAEQAKSDLSHSLESAEHKCIDLTRSLETIQEENLNLTSSLEVKRDELESELAASRSRESRLQARLRDHKRRVRIEAERAEEATKRADLEAKRAIVEAKRADMETIRAEKEARLAEQEVRRAEEEARRAEEEARRAEEEAKRADEAMRLADLETKRANVEAERAEREAERAEKEAERAEKEAERAEREAERAEEEVKRAEKEAERAEKEAERAEKEAERAEKEAERAEKEAQRAEEATKWAEKEAQRAKNEAERAEKVEKEAKRAENEGENAAELASCLEQARERAKLAVERADSLERRMEEALEAEERARARVETERGIMETRSAMLREMTRKLEIFCEKDKARRQFWYDALEKAKAALKTTTIRLAESNQREAKITTDLINTNIILDVKTKELSDSREREVRRVTELGDVREELQAVRRTLEESEVVGRHQIREVEARTNSLKSERDRLINEAENLEKRLKIANEMVKAEKARTNALMSERDSLINETENLDKLLKIADKKINAKKARLDAESSEVRGQIDKVSRQLQKTSRELSEKAQEVLGLELELKTTKVKAQDLEIERDEMVRDNAQRSNRLRNLTQAITEWYNDERHRREEHENRATETVEKLKTKAAGLEMALRQAELEKEEIKTKMIMECKANHSLEDFADIQRRSRNLQTLRERFERWISYEKDRREKERDRVREMEVEVYTQRAIVKTQDSTIQHYEASLAESKKLRNETQHELHSEIHTLKDDLQAYKEIAQDFQQEIKSQQLEAHTRKKLLGALTQTFALSLSSLRLKIVDSSEKSAERMHRFHALTNGFQEAISVAAMPRHMVKPRVARRRPSRLRGRDSPIIFLRGKRQSEDVDANAADVKLASPLADTQYGGRWNQTMTRITHGDVELPDDKNIKTETHIDPARLVGISTMEAVNLVAKKTAEAAVNPRAASRHGFGITYSGTHRTTV
ncbi:hypothetical protein AAMO2058_000028100 [Amorphochlora amoebiformis]